MNVSILLKFSTWDSASQHVTLTEIMCNASSLYVTQLAEKKPKDFQQVSNLTERKSISTT